MHNIHTAQSGGIQRFGLALTILAAIAVGITTLMPMPQIPGVPGGDKTLHIIAFAAIVFPTSLLSPRYLIHVVLIGILYGAMIEIIQPSFGRHREMLDVGADALGLGLGAVAGRLITVASRQAKLTFLSHR